MGKRSGVTKSGRIMNPADRERKQQRAKELKRNKKQRTAVRQAIVKNRNPEELVEQMSRLDDQEFDPERELALTVIQEKRNKMRGAFFQIVNLARQEKEEKRVKNLEKMLYEYEMERSKKEENFRAQIFSENANFEEIPLPIGVPDTPDAAKTPFAPGLIGPQEPARQAMKAGILKKPQTTGKKHKYPPGPPPGLAPSLSDSDEEDEENEGAQESRDDGTKRRRVRFGEERRRRRRGEGEEDEEGGGDEDEEDYAPVEIPDSMLAVEKEPPPQQQPVYSRAAPPVMPPSSTGRPLPPGMAPPPPGYPPGYYPPNMPPEMQAQAMRTGRMPAPPQRMMTGGNTEPLNQQPHLSKTGLINYPSEPYPSAVISAAPQVVKPTVDVTPPSAAEVTISASPQMRNIRREATRFVPTAVKIQRPVVPQQSTIGPKIPTSSIAGPSRILPPKAMKKAAIPQGHPTKTADEACDEFLRELEGLL